MITKVNSKTGFLLGLALSPWIEAAANAWLCKASRSAKQLKLGLHQHGSFLPASQTRQVYLQHVKPTDAQLMAPISTQKKQQTNYGGGWGFEEPSSK